MKGIFKKVLMSMAFAIMFCCTCFLCENFVVNEVYAQNMDGIESKINKVISKDADITYKDTEDGKTVIYVTKDGKTTENTFDHIDNEVKIAIDQAMALRKKKSSLT